MEVGLLLPLLSEKDPLGPSGGSRDPLGLAPISAHLAKKLVPGFGEQQWHPRLLTCIAVSLRIGRTYFDGDYAKDSVGSEPWQVFEWYLVQGLFRGGLPAGVTLPGKGKAKAAEENRLGLSAKSYLKGPGSAGFHGIYRTLAGNLEIERDGQVGETGSELTQVWEKGQGLSGFFRGEGKEQRALRTAIDEGLKQGRVYRKWRGWGYIPRHFAIDRPGRGERQVITKALLGPKSGHRKEVLEYLCSLSGQAAWLAGGQESAFHKALLKESSKELRVLLKAIGAYEKFSRLLQNAFDDVITELQEQGRPVALRGLAALPGVKTAAKDLGALFEKAGRALEPFGEEVEQFRRRYGGLTERGSNLAWLKMLVEHHRAVQKGKERDPWLLREAGKYELRGRYLDYVPARGHSYVHFYRTGPLWSFAKELRLAK